MFISYTEQVQRCAKSNARAIIVSDSLHAIVTAFERAMPGMWQTVESNRPIITTFDLAESNPEIYVPLMTQHRGAVFMVATKDEFNELRNIAQQDLMAIIHDE